MPVDLFYSYSHKDEGLRDELDTHLALLRRRGVLNVWHDRKITAGDQWRTAIDSHLESADIVLLLVTPDFIASDYCYDVEMTHAMQRHQAGQSRVVPVIARAVDFEGAPFGEIQALPKDARPVTSWPNRDEAWTDVAKSIRKVAETIAATKPPQPPSPPPPPPPGASSRGGGDGGSNRGATTAGSAPAAASGAGPDADPFALPAEQRTVIGLPGRRPQVPPSPPTNETPSPPPDYVGGTYDPEFHFHGALARALTGFQQDMGNAMDLAALQKRAPAEAFDPYAAWSIGERLAAIAGWRRILWVDDEPGNNATETAAFNRVQIEVETRVSTEEALDALEATREAFDLVVSDWTRPERVPGLPEGLRLLREIRARGLGAPVIIYHGRVSASELTRRRQLVEEAGGQGVTSRPDELFELATRLLSAPR